MPPRLMVPLPDGSFFVPCAGSKRAAGEENLCWLEALNCFSVGADQRAEFWAAADRRVGYCHAHEYGAAPSASERTGVMRTLRQCHAPTPRTAASADVAPAPLA